MRFRRAVAAAGGAAVLALAPACGSSPTEEPEADPSAPESSATAATDRPTADVADPEHAVDPPGPVQTPLEQPDMLIVDPRGGISDDVAERVRSTMGVTEVIRLGIVQVSIENKVYDVAVVDPASYRRFTKDESATLQDQWDRVAGGEVAVAQVYKDRLPVDDEGYLRLGSTDEDPRIHVGAWAPQVPTVDFVVNAAWGEELGMTEPNALLVSARKSTPQKLAKPLRGITGGNVPTQNLDVASRLGLDPRSGQVVTTTGEFSDAVGVFRYRVLSGGRIAPDPAWVRSHIVTETVPILGSVTCNKHMMPQLKGALTDIVRADLEHEIHRDEYAGCYYPRFIAGSTQLSNHAFGLALDLNVPGNQRGTVGQMHRGVVDIFKRWGFGWGGDWAYTDPMHFELREIRRPG